MSHRQGDNGSMERTLTALDRILVDAQNALATVFGGVHAERPNPGAGEAEVVLDESERRVLLRERARARGASDGG